MEKKKVVILTREEELEVLKARNERIRLDPAYGIRLLQQAGIVDENGQLTEKYRAD